MSISLLSMQLQNIKCDFKSDFLFPTCSVDTNLVTSLEFNPLRSATMLCQFGQTQCGSVATHFNLFSSTATSIATGDHVAVPKSFDQNEEPAIRKYERGTDYKQVHFLSQNVFKRRTEKLCVFVAVNHVFLSSFYSMSMNLFFFSLWNAFWYHICTGIYCVGTEQALCCPSLTD